MNAGVINHGLPHKFSEGFFRRCIPVDVEHVRLFVVVTGCEAVAGPQVELFDFDGMRRRNFYLLNLVVNAVSGVPALIFYKEAHFRLLPCPKGEGVYQFLALNGAVRPGGQKDDCEKNEHYPGCNHPPASGFLFLIPPPIVRRVDVFIVFEFVGEAPILARQVEFKKFFVEKEGVIFGALYAEVDQHHLIVTVHHQVATILAVVHAHAIVSTTITRNCPL